MDIEYTVNTPKLVCCVCKQKADFVACSSTGAFTLAYCKSCADKGLEPYDLLVSLGFYEDFNDTYRENVVKPSLEYYGKTVEQFNADVLQSMNDYLSYIKSKSVGNTSDEDDDSEWDVPINFGEVNG